MKFVVILFALAAFFCGQTFAAEKKPLKVFILAGQSNMEGHAKIETFDRAHGPGFRRSHAYDDEEPGTMK